MIDFGPFFERPLAVLIERGKAKSDKLAEAMMAGWGGSPGGIIVREPAGLPAQAYAAAFIGLRPSTARLLREAHTLKRQFLTVDNGYFDPYPKGPNFRVTMNALQVKSTEEAPTAAQRKRWEQLNITLKSWRRRGDHVLLILQSAPWYSMVLGINREDWVRDVLTQIEEATDRPIVIRDKPLKGSKPLGAFAQDLDNAWAVVALSSNCLIQAACEGVPAFPVGEHATALLAGPLTDLERPVYSDMREPVFLYLANNQWTAEEMASGAVWRELASRPEPDFRPLS